MNKKQKIIGVLIILLIIVNLVAFLPRQKEETIRIGAILSLTGPAAPYGTWGKNAINLAIKEIEENTKDKIEVIIEDDNTDPKNAVSAAQKLIQVDKVKVIIMVTSSTALLSAAPVTEQNEVILFSSMSSSPKISEAGDYVFRNRVSGLLEASKAANFINQLDKNKIALLGEISDFGIDYSNVFKNKILEFDKQILLEETYVQKETDFRTNLVKLKEQDPEVVYVLCYINDCINIFKQAEEIDFKPIWVTTSGIENQNLIELNNPDLFSRIFYVSEFYDLEDPVIKEFNDKYETVYKEKTTLYASNSYDALYILYSAIKKVGNEPDKIKDYLYNLENYKGVNGILTFDDNGDVIKPLMIKTIKNNEFVKYKE